MNRIREVITAGAKLAQGILAHITGAERKPQRLPLISREDLAQMGRGRALRVVTENGVQSVSLCDVNDIERGHRFTFGGIPDEALVYPLVDSIKAVLAVDARAFANGFKTYTGREHVYTDEGIELLNDRLLVAARVSGVKLAFKSSPDSLETCAVISFVAQCAKAAWFPGGPDSDESYEFLTRRLVDEFWSQRRRGTGKSYAVLVPMLKSLDTSGTSNQ